MAAVIDLDEPDTRCDLGVLLVHGIGQQSKGSTLVQFGDPMCEWISRWTGVECALEHCDLAPGEDAPARVEMRSPAGTWLLNG